MPRLHRLAIALVLLGCRPSSPPPMADVAADAKAVEGVLRAWYDASAAHDSAAYVAAMHPDFFIFEDTTRYDRAALAKLVIESFVMGTDKAMLSDFNTQVAGDVAWTSFRNEEVFTPNGATPMAPRRYLESVVFRRVDGRWLIERYHATRIKGSATPD